MSLETKMMKHAAQAILEDHPNQLFWADLAYWIGVAASDMEATDGRNKRGYDDGETHGSKTFYMHDPVATIGARVAEAYLQSKRARTYR